MTTTRHNQISSFATRKAIIFALFIVFLVGDAMPVQDNLNGTTWLLVSWSESDASIPILDDNNINLQFDDKAVRGSAGCNQYVGTYEADGDRLDIGIIGSSRKLCAADFIEQENRFLVALQGVKRYQFNKSGQIQITYWIGETFGLMTFDQISP